MNRLMILVVLGLAHLVAASEPKVEPTKRVEADMGPGCRFAAQVPEGIQATNSKGYAGIREDITGDEERRVRGLSFCLFHPPMAICGYGMVGMLRDGRKGDLTPHALKIIRSIEFLPDEPQPQSADTPIPAPAPDSTPGVKP